MGIKGGENGHIVSNGTRIQLESPTQSMRQSWYVDTIGRVISRSCAKCIAMDETVSSNSNSARSIVYVWDVDNSPAQQWYFEAVGGRSTTSIKRSHNGPKETLATDVIRTYPCDETTYQCWLRVDQFESGHKKLVFRQGSSMIVALAERDFKLLVSVTTTQGKQRCTETDLSSSSGSWVNIALVVKAESVDTYINGALRTRSKLSGVVNPTGGTWSLGSTGLQLMELEYSNYALNGAQIKQHMNVTDPSRTREMTVKVGGAANSGRVDVEIPPSTESQKDALVLNLTSNGTHPDCNIDNAGLGSVGWCAFQNTVGYFLQVDLRKKTHVSHIITQGRSTVPQWVTSYEIKYRSDEGQWVDYTDTMKLGTGPTQLPGNTDNTSPKENAVNFVTQSFRLFPKTWYGWPSCRIGIKGTPFKKYLCDGYQRKGLAGSEADRQLNKDLYNKECRTVSYYDYLKALSERNTQGDSLVSELKRCQDESQLLRKRYDSAEEESRSFKKRIDGLEISVQMERNRQCPPVKDCLPVVNNMGDTGHMTVNDFDIRTHKDFYKYTLASKVHSCPSVKSANSAKRETDEAGACQQHFISQKGGGDTVYARLCSLTGTGTATDKIHCSSSTIKIATNPKPSDIRNKVRQGGTLSRAFAEDPYSITRHKDFERLMSQYVKKDQIGHCNEKQIQRLLTDIRYHPQYQLLVKSIRFKGCSL